MRAATPGAPDIGRYGIWDATLARTEVSEAAEAAAELAALGFGALWLGGSTTVDQAAPLVAHTSGIVLATGIQSIWAWDAADAAVRYAELDAAHPGRFLLGLGSVTRS
jgi:alkanesulfonate monooxygenase SsuD/methylene tetrahydromethanopterin reductase-like flavin-dependent oxidoreductase (luciferase family)